jgi:hypothetical protein
MPIHLLILYVCSRFPPQRHHQLEINVQHARKSVSSTRSKTKFWDKTFGCGARSVSLISLCPSSELQKASYWDFLYVIYKYESIKWPSHYEVDGGQIQ